MNLEKLFNLIFDNLNDINIQYSNINGEEKLLINGEEIKSESESEDHTVKFDDTDILKEVDNFKNNVNGLDDELFIKLIEQLNGMMDVNEFDKLLNQESFIENEAECVHCLIEQTNTVIIDIISNEIERFEELRERFK